MKLQLDFSQSHVPRPRGAGLLLRVHGRLNANGLIFGDRFSLERSALLSSKRLASHA